VQVAHGAPQEDENWKSDNVPKSALADGGKTAAGSSDDDNDGAVDADTIRDEAR
jgi:hypothetical protein